MSSCNRWKLPTQAEKQKTQSSTNVLNSFMLFIVEGIPVLFRQILELFFKKIKLVLFVGELSNI